MAMMDSRRRRAQVKNRELSDITSENAVVYDKAIKE